jgi:molybdopterin-guanine dinucleotide biosynthesis protein MobB
VSGLTRIAGRRVFGVTGWKNAGKTTMVERLVREMTGRGLRVATLKHAHHAFDVDHPGRDSHRHRMAGAAQVLVASRNRWALMTETPEAAEPTLEALLERLDPADLTLIEGWKRDRHAKLEVWRAAAGNPLIARDDPTVIAVACDADPGGLAQPLLPVDDAAAVADFVLARVGL